MVMEKIKTYFCLGKIFMPGLQTGYEIYPITYKGKPYVVRITVDLSTVHDVRDLEDLDIVCKIFTYSGKKQLLRGHKRNLVCKMTKCSLVKIDEENLLDIRKISEEELKIYLPEIMKALFEKHEQEVIDKEEKEKQMERVEKWDGVIRS